MFFTLGLALLFFLPVIESFDRNLAFNILMIGSIMISLSTFWKKKLAFDFIELLWVMMLIIFTLSATLSWSLSRSYIELLRYFAYFLIFVSIRRFYKPEILLKRFFIPMVLVNTIILSGLYILTPILKLPQPENRMSLFDLLSLGHNHLADILIFAIPMTIFMLQKKLSGFLSLFFIIMLVFSLSRGAMISLSLAFFIYIIANNVFQKNAGIFAKLILLLTSVITIFLLSSFIYSNFLIQEHQKDNALKGFYKPVIKENRLQYIVQAWKGFKQFPVFGTGLDTFRYVSKLHQSAPLTWSWYTHNHFLQIFTETGFLGGVLFLSLIATLLVGVYKYINLQLIIYNLKHSALFIAIIASTIHSIIDFDWQFVSIFLIFWIAAGLSFSKKETDSKKSSFTLILFILIVFLFYLAQFFIPLNSEKLVIKDDLISILQAYRLDSKNTGIVKRLAQLEAKSKDYDKAHSWYKTAMLLVPYESYDSIKQDSLLYLAQIKKAVEDKNINLSLLLIKTFAEIYPFYFQISGGDYYLVNANKMNKLKDKNKALQFVKEFTTITQRKLSAYKLSPLEIQLTVDNLKKLKTIY